MDETKTDGALITAWRAGSEEAFAELVRRYTRLVYGTCRRLAGAAVAEDAAQAVFLVFVRKGRSLGRRPVLGAWFYRTATLVALAARRRAGTRQRREEEAAEMRERDEVVPESATELRGELDRLMTGLPRREREAVTLCCLSGRTQQEAARELGCPPKTVQSRLRRALERMRAGLSRRGGIALSAAAFGAALAAAVEVEVPGALLATLTGLGSKGAAATAAGGGEAATLAKGAMRTMTWMKAKLAAAVLAAVAVTVGGGGAVYRLATAESAEPAEPKEAAVDDDAKKQLNPKLLAMPDNSWLKLSPPREPKSRAYSGCCFGGGLMWHFGGAHRSYMGNDVDIYDPIKNEWRGSEIEWPDEANIKLMASVKAPNQPVTPKGRPWPGHTYQQVCWVPERKAFFMVNRGHTWEFDPEKMKWSCLAGEGSVDKKFSPKSQGAQTAHVLYSPELKAPVLILTTRPFGSFVYNYEKMEWEKRKNAPMSWAELYSTYVESRKVHLVSWNKEPYMWTYQAETEEWKVLADVPEKLRGSKALAYDSTNDVVLALAPAKGADEAPLAMWLMDPETNKWSEQKPANDPPATRSIFAPIWYDPDHNVFLYLRFVNRGPDFKGGKTETWAYRYKKAAEK